MSEKIEVLDAQIRWADNFDNDPTLYVQIDRRPEWDLFDKRPCARQQTSDDQNAIIGARQKDAAPGWHIYHSEDSGFVWFFTWGGEPDDGFGGSRKVHKIRCEDCFGRGEAVRSGVLMPCPSCEHDGYDEEEIVGGWMVGTAAAQEAGFAEVIGVTTFDSQESWDRGYTGMAGFITVERAEAVVAEHLPEVEWVQSRYTRRTFKWRGYPTKHEWRVRERARKKALIAKLEEETGRKWIAGILSAEGDLYLEHKDDPLYQIRPYSKVPELLGKVGA